MNRAKLWIAGLLSKKLYTYGVGEVERIKPERSVSPAKIIFYMSKLTVLKPNTSEFVYISIMNLQYKVFYGRRATYFKSHI